MATVKTSDGWMTSFIYEQDLTSAYMNGVLYSLFRPGIYNADFILKRGKYDKGSEEGTGLSLFIKKGTTFVFSNDYMNIYDQLENSGNVTDQLYRRTFTCNVPDSTKNKEPKSLLGGNFPLIIKCVAMRDILITGIAQPAPANSGNDMSCQRWEGESSAPDVLYLCALMRYDQTGTNDFPSVPIFLLVRNNPYYGSNKTSIYYGNSGNTSAKNPADVGDSEYNRVFYFHTHEDWREFAIGSTGSWRLPDGSIQYSAEAHTTGMTQLSYLMLGVLVDTSKKASYEKFEEEWFKNHTFTARCLPEYRNNMIGASNTQFPDYIIPYKYNSELGHNFGRLYVDFKNVLNFGNIYNTSIDWESAYGIASTSTAGFWSFSPLAGVENEDYVNLELTSEEIKKLVSTDEAIGTDKNVSLVLDFTFGVTKNVMNSASNLDHREDKLDSSSFSKNNKMKLFNHREIIDLYFYKGDSYLSDDYKNIIQFVQIISPDASDTDRVQLKLDICSNNSRRLLDLIKNNNILYRVINKVRANGSLNAALGESLIPIAISFRLLGKSSTDPSSIPVAVGRSYIEVDVDNNHYYVINFAGDNISSPYSVNPLNSIGLLDLEYKMTKINALSTKTQNAYTVLPVID